jgi:hypothetical protein
MKKVALNELRVLGRNPNARVSNLQSRIAVNIWRLIGLAVTSEVKLSKDMTKRLSNALEALDMLREQIYAEPAKSGHQFSRITAIELLARAYKSKSRDIRPTIRQVLCNILNIGVPVTGSADASGRFNGAVAMLQRSREKIQSDRPGVKYDLKDLVDVAATNVEEMFQRFYKEHELAKIGMGHKNYRKLQNKKAPVDWYGPLTRADSGPIQEEKTRFFLDHIAGYSAEQVERAMRELAKS